MAPGTTGKWTVVLKNLSDVDATISCSAFSVTGTNLPENLKITIGDVTVAASAADETTWTDVKLVKTNGEATVDIVWDWAYETGTEVVDGLPDEYTGDKDDTADGVGAQTDADIAFRLPSLQRRNIP